MINRLLSRGSGNQKLSQRAFAQTPETSQPGPHGSSDIIFGRMMWQGDPTTPSMIHSMQANWLTSYLIF